MIAPRLPFLLLTLCLPAFAAAQRSVLTLQTSYHVGTYSGTIDTPSGDLLLLAGVGDMDLTAAGDVNGQLDLLETDLFGPVVTPNDPFTATYFVQPNGEIVFDFDPANPGAELFSLWIDTDGSVMHGARQGIDPEALSFLAIEKSTGLDNAALNGTYCFYSQRMEFNAGTWETFGEWGTATFDGTGGGFVSSTELAATPAGSSTSLVTGPFPYSVASDGALTLGGATGAVSADGELLFAVVSEPGSGEVGMLIGVRQGASYDFADLTGRYSLAAQGHQLGFGPGLPRTNTAFGELLLTDTSTSTGLWTLIGVSVDGSAAGITETPLTGSGGATLTATGEMTLSDPSGSVELCFSANGKFATGRVVEPATNLLFAQRQCLPCNPYGTATAGSGGIDPAIGMLTFPTVGNPAWGIQIDDCLGGGIAVIAIGFASLPGIPVFGGPIWIDPTGAVIAALLLSGTPGQPGDGAGEILVGLPNVPSLAGTELFAQGIVIDAGGPEGFALTSGFRATVCR